jgi:hypothetical protein
MNMEPTEPLTVSGGELPPAWRERFLKLRALLLKEDDVHAVHGLSYLPEEDRWLYWIQTPFATWPKHVVGTTDEQNEMVAIALRCGDEWTARKEFEALNEEGVYA